VFQEDAKEYFLTKSSTSPYDCDFDAVAYAFRRIERNEGKFNIQNCSTIDELRSMKNVNIFEEINLNKLENFRSSSLFFLFEIMKKLKFSDEEVYEIFTLYFKLISRYKNILLNLKLYLLSDIITTPNITTYVLGNLCFISAEIILSISEDIETRTKYFLNFLKEKLSNENYNKSFATIFVICLQSNNSYHLIDNVKASILYSELKNVYNDLNVQKHFFKNWQNFFNLFTEKALNRTALDVCLQTYFKILDEDHLTMLLLNEYPQNFNTIIKIFFMFETGCYVLETKQLLLNLLESRYSDNEKLFNILDKSHIVEVSTLSEENFSLVFEFCKKHFEDSNIEALLFPPGDRAKPCLKHMNVLNTIMSLFMETFDIEKWKIFFFKTYENDNTIIHELMLSNITENALKLIDLAKNKLGDDFEKLMNLRDANGSSIASLKDQKCKTLGKTEENNENK